MVLATSDFPFRTQSVASNHLTASSVVDFIKHHEGARLASEAMEATMTAEPGTPLPWSISRPGYMQSANGEYLPPFNWNRARQDDAYVVEACNAYPGLLARITEHFRRQARSQHRRISDPDQSVESGSSLSSSSYFRR